MTSKRQLSPETVRLIWNFVLVTVVGGLLTYGYQTRMAAANIRAQELAANRAGATQLFDEVTALLAHRRYNVEVAAGDRLRRRPGPVVRPEQFRTDREWYQAANRLRATTCRFFGPLTATVLQEQMVHLDYLSGLLDVHRDMVAHRKWTDSAATYIRESRGGPDSLLRRVTRALDSAAVNEYRFNLRMEKQVQTGDLADPLRTNCDLTLADSSESMLAALWRMRVMYAATDTLPLSPRYGAPSN